MIFFHWLTFQYIKEVLETMEFKLHDEQFSVISFKLMFCFLPLI